MADFAAANGDLFLQARRGNVGLSNAARRSRLRNKNGVAEGKKKEKIPLLHDTGFHYITAEEEGREKGVLHSGVCHFTVTP